MFSWLGKFQKGRATFAGLAIVLLGIAGQTDLAQEVASVSEQLGQVAVLAGSALATFGVGRKTGYAATTPPTRRY